MKLSPGVDGNKYRDPEQNAESEKPWNTVLNGISPSNFSHQSSGNLGGGVEEEIDRF